MYDLKIKIDKVKSEYQNIKPLRGKYKSIDNEKRRTIIHAIEKEKIKMKAVSASLDIPYQTIAKIYRDYIVFKKIDAKPKGGNREKILNDSDVIFIKKLLEEDCTLTLKQIQKSVKDVLCKDISTPSLHRYNLGFNFTIKRLNLFPEPLITPELELNRRSYCRQFLDGINDNKIYVFYGEAGFQLTMKRFQEKTASMIPKLRCRNKMISAAMTSDCVLHYRVRDCPIDADMLLEYTKELMGIVRERNMANVCIVMHDTQLHRSEQIRQLINAHGCGLAFLPEYAVQLSPVDNLFAKLEGLVRGKAPVNEEKLYEAIADARNNLTIDECENYFNDAIDNAKGCVYLAD